MPEIFIIIILHQLIFQGMFVIKNLVLYLKIKKQIRGKNIEATISIVFFAFFVALALVMSFLSDPFSKISLMNEITATVLGSGLMLLNLVISGASLINLKDSWRIGVVEGQKTELVTSGIYRFTRNPYFVSYCLMFTAYTIMLQNLILLGLSLIGFLFIHKMIMKEEKYLYSLHGEAYLMYKKKVPRYLIV